MNSEEQKQILKMVEDGKISAEDALKLMRAVENSTAEDDSLAPPATTFESGFDSEKPESPEFEEIAFKARSLWQIVLWVSVTVVVLSAYWLYTFVRASNYGFWFFCAMTPLLFGVLLLALFTGSRTSRWLYVNVEQPQNEWPRNITIGLPLPLGLASWFLLNFGYTIEGMNHDAVDEILEFLSKGFSSKEPLIVNVNEGPGGERVRVYIG
jgi:hypothetical protein